MKDLVFRAPGFFRTLASTLVIAAGVAEQVAPIIAGNLQGAALVTAILGVVRAVARKSL